MRWWGYEVAWVYRQPLRGDGRFYREEGVGLRLGIKIVDAARKYIGLPYIWGGGHGSSDPWSGLDCSGLCRHALQDATGQPVPDGTTATYYQLWEPVWLGALEPGDFLFFDIAGDGEGDVPDHMSIRTDFRRHIQAPQEGDVVRESPLTDWMLERLIGARRAT